MYHDERGVVGRREILRIRPDLAESFDAVDASFTVRVTRSFAARADLADPRDPLAIQVLPDPRELSDTGLDDPVGEQARMVAPWLVRKYRDRVLWMLTKRCHLYCRYCFRRTHDPSESLDPRPDEVEAALSWMAQAEGLREVVFSGGDPLVLKDPVLLDRVARVRELGPRVRIHTRAPISYPARVTAPLARSLALARVWMVVHTNHPRELSPAVLDALGVLADAGVPLLSQSVLLRGVNDDPDVLVELFDALVRARVRPYYLHHPDAVRGNAHFGVSREMGLSLMDRVRERIGGLAVPAYVEDPPDGSGKRPVAPSDSAAV